MPSCNLKPYSISYCVKTELSVPLWSGLCVPLLQIPATLTVCFITKPSLLLPWGIFYFFFQCLNRYSLRSLLLLVIQDSFPMPPPRGGFQDLPHSVTFPGCTFLQQWSWLFVCLWPELSCPMKMFFLRTVTIFVLLITICLTSRIATGSELVSNKVLNKELMNQWTSGLLWNVYKNFIHSFIKCLNWEGHRKPLV